MNFLGNFLESIYYNILLFDEVGVSSGSSPASITFKGWFQLAILVVPFYLVYTWLFTDNPIDSGFIFGMFLLIPALMAFFSMVNRFFYYLTALLLLVYVPYQSIFA